MRRALTPAAKVMDTKTNRTPHAELLAPAHVMMKLLHYTDRSAFWKMVKRESVPCVRVSARKILFSEAVVMAFLAARQSRATS